MTEQKRCWSNCSRGDAFKSSIIAVLVLTAFNLVIYMAFEHFGYYGIHSRMNNLITYSENISNEVERIVQQFNGSVLSNRNIHLATEVYSSTGRSSLPDCPKTPPKLVGPLATYRKSPSIPEIEKEYAWLHPGGRYSPVECHSEHRVAVIIPYRNREDQLKTFLYNIHPILQRQQINYGIYVIEQSGNNTFNRALLMNIGYAESVKIYDYNCFVFHDVDLIPEDDRIHYGCGKQPRHLSAAIDKFQYRLPYGNIFGGVSQLSKDVFVKINGFSNKYFGWGGEDDDLSARVRSEGFRVERYPMNIARYKMFKHQHESSNSQNPNRFHLLQQATKRYKTDGLNSLKYRVLNIAYNKLYTMVTVEVKKSDYKLKR
ncbi:beta-1,4-N-acetylgalactosaminyltransferase bre-4-like [Pecten maximus]|uniref:beta-1,4-N-acetylgalactosaminyltransferase bre-4-like n=1 Tax=Pecten maximus TaxID=6579 RepID=UPI0014582365|nr:beta-1,4-N-acetylgalactosaminyltransferase bre-4-like [Pecten maximus]XP_033739976.1 beta-1,4-N-acetylgalactosaminyltransferase bre-4-like [Pecten maximus]